MESKLTTSGIFFQNKLYQRGASNKAVCLNPSCSSKRVFQFYAKTDLITHQDHENCKGWVCSIDKLKKLQKGQDEAQIGSVLSTDYFENPIDSICYIEKFASIRWEDHLFSYFQQLKNSIDEEMGKIYIKCQKEIKQHLQANRKTYNNLQVFLQKEPLKSEEELQQFYKDHLESSLKQIQKTGMLKISNHEMMQKKMELLIGQLKTIEECIWNKQLQYDLNKRLLSKVQKEELRDFSMDSNVQQINSKIQIISNNLKTTIKYVQSGKVLRVACFICPTTLHSNASNIKARKQECRNALLNHMLSNHIEQIASKQFVGSPLKLTLEELRRDIICKHVKKVVVVDKQNMSHLKYEEINNYPEYYCIEVVSKNSEYLAKSKYLLAESKGKDSADILTIIVLWELSRLKLERIVLLTKDHYGETLKPIFSSLGADIVISDTPYDY